MNAAWGVGEKVLEAQEELGFTHGVKGGSRRRFNQERDKVRVSFWGDGARPRGSWETSGGQVRVGRRRLCSHRGALLGPADSGPEHPPVWRCPAPCRM